MSTFSSILVPLDGSLAAARSLECAAWLAERLHARLHVLTAADTPQSPRDELRRLHVSESRWRSLELHQVSDIAERAIVEAADRHDVDLLVLSARGDSLPSDDDRILGHVARSVLERYSRPVLLTPPRYREVRPWDGLIVPISGAVACDDALSIAARVASDLDISVKVVHVANPNAADEGLDVRARYADALHHEYSGQLEGLLARALPLLPSRQRQRVEGVRVSGGNVLGRVVDVVAAAPGAALVAGWHGNLGPGRAELLKGLIGTVSCPLLLVKQRTRRSSQLNIGEALD